MQALSALCAGKSLDLVAPGLSVSSQGLVQPDRLCSASSVLLPQMRYRGA